MDKQVDWRRELPQVELLENEPMSRHTTFRIGGPAKWMFRPRDTDQAAAILRLCHTHDIRPFFLGNGSNLLVSDRGCDAVVVDTSGLDRMTAAEGETTIYADSGVPLSRLACFAADQGMAGLEFASGIPGSVGGAVRMNAGAYGGEICQVLARVDYLDEVGTLHTAQPEDCGFSYRRSVFGHKPWLITGTLFTLTHGSTAEIRGRMAQLNRQRREKQPLEYPSAGSTFKRPQEYFAAALIEECGLKGLSVGGAQVSEKHSGFVINRGDATCADVLALMEKVQERVYAKTGVLLEPEVEILG